MPRKSTGRSSLADKLYFTCLKRGMRYDEVAVRARVSSASVYRIIRGAHVPHPSTLAAIEGALDLDAGELASLANRRPARRSRRSTTKAS